MEEGERRLDDHCSRCRWRWSSCCSIWRSILCSTRWSCLSNVRGPVAGRHLGPVSDRHEFQHCRGRRIHVDFRRGDHGRLAVGVSFNQLRADGMPLRQAIMQGAERRVRPVMMTALTAIFGLLPAAISTKVGAQIAKAAGDRRRRQHDCNAVPDSLPDAGALQLLRAPRSARYGRRLLARVNRPAAVSLASAFAHLRSDRGDGKSV